MVLSFLLLLSALLPRALARQEAPRAPDLAFAPRRWALVVGANDYEHLGRLRYARSDAAAFAKTLVESLGFRGDAVRLLTDDSRDARFLPTAGHVIGELEALLADPRRTRSDLFVFYFCGHGAGLESGDYLLPTDARDETLERLGLSMREVITRLAASGMSNVLVIVDACREGAEHPFGRELFELAGRARIGVLLGCAPGRQSYEDARRGHGIFTAELLQALATEGLRETSSGALWFSRVAQATAAAVQGATAREAVPQEPALWYDPTRDVLLSATLPAELGPERLAAFLESSEHLTPEAQAAALLAYAEELARNGRGEECVQVLKVAEQLGPLAPPAAFLMYSNLLGLGRSLEAARALQELRTREAESLHALVAGVIDQSGGTSEVERSQAARELWESGVQVPFDLLVLMVQAHMRAGAGSEALEIARAALEQAPAGSADGAYLSAAVALLSGNPEQAAEDFERCEGLEGGLCDRRSLRAERVSAQAQAGRILEAIELCDRSVADWPEDGRWLAERAWLKRRSARSLAELDAAALDARAALERELAPAHVLLAVRAAGARAPELCESVRAQAERCPLSFESQIAAVFACQPADMAQSVASATRLAGRPDLAYATLWRMTIDGLIEQCLRARTLHGPDSPEERATTEAFAAAWPRALQVLVARSGGFGGDPQAWRLLSELFARAGEYDAFARLVERRLGERIARGLLSDELAGAIGIALLNSGREEGFREVTRDVQDGGVRDMLAWRYAAYLATRGRDAEAREVLGERVQPRDLASQGELAPALLGLLAARGGGEQRARELLVQDEPERDPLALALHYLAWLALDEPGRADRWLEALSQRTPLDGFYGLEACMRGQPGRDPREIALLAATALPVNGLLAETSFLPEPALEAFVGAHAYELQPGAGPLVGEGATLTLTVLKGGKLVGTWIGASGDSYVLQGTLDAYGNLEAELDTEGGSHLVLAKLVPRQAWEGYAPLEGAAQRFTVIEPGGHPSAWLGAPVR